MMSGVIKESSKTTLRRLSVVVEERSKKPTLRQTKSKKREAEKEAGSSEKLSSATRESSKTPMRESSRPDKRKTLVSPRGLRRLNNVGMTAMIFIKLLRNYLVVALILKPRRCIKLQYQCILWVSSWLHKTTGSLATERCAMEH